MFTNPHLNAYLISEVYLVEKKSKKFPDLISWHSYADQNMHMYTYHSSTNHRISKENHDFHQFSLIFATFDDMHATPMPHLRLWPRDARAGSARGLWESFPNAYACPGHCRIVFGPIRRFLFFVENRDFREILENP